MWTLYINSLTLIVMQVFVRIPGVAYDPPAGQFMLEVPRQTFVGIGFTASQDGQGAWTFAPPVEDEPAPDEGKTVQELIAELTAKANDILEQAAALSAKLG